MIEKIKNQLKKYSILISIFLGCFVAIGLKLQYINETDFLGFTNRANDMIFLIFIAGICLLIYYSLKVQNKRLWIISIVISIFFSICYYLGDIQNNYIYTYVPTTKKFFIYSIIKLITYFIIFKNCIVILYTKLPIIAKKFNTQKEWKFFADNKKSIFFIAIIFFISYIPFFLYYYPGNVNTDSVGSLYQITGISKYTNFQPILYTLILGGLWNFGKAMFGSSVAGIATYTIFQMLCTSFVFSVVLYYMAKRKIDLKWRIITFLFFILNPMNGWFVVRCEKGMLFHISLILVILGIIDIIHERDKFFEKKWKPICFVLITIIMIFIRNNGIYTIILTLPFLLFACKDIWKKVCSIFGVIIITTLIIQGPIFKILDINYSNPGEALSIPMQQFARISKYANERLNEEELQVIKKYFPVDIEKLSKDYVPWKSDATKANFDQNEFKKEKSTFIKQYFKFAFKFPMQTISSLIMNTGIIYSPNFNVWGLSRNYGTETQDAYGTLSEGDDGKILQNFVKTYPIESEPIINIEKLDKLNNIIVEGKIPILLMLIENIGLYFWVTILCISYCIYTKEYKNIIMLLPIIGLWITNVAAPMVDIRYIYPMFLMIPIFIGIILADKKKSV